ncbi:hypothetical protein F7725_020500 [Dissostichus mawsoni]|uniref:Uncharacterized protein n=1 Tax=Dissostichus mawsoni TaxID=36200 RepID=A0A7J5YDE1_DISMA|nr:hypothetical protein F7725_020500 [Dissostichus mawsoni]
MVRDVLQSKLGGEKILQEYATTETLMDGTRRQMVNLLVADMIEVHGRIPPTHVREKCALGIITLFPRDPHSKNGYQLTGEECREAISFMKHSADESVVKRR